MNKRKILALAMALSIVAILAVGATLAYFTDTDSATNVFTVGSVDIKLLESTLHRQNDNATDDMIIADAEKYQAYLTEAGENIVPGQWVKKAPYVQNNGDNDAFVRVRVRFPAKLAKVLKFMEYTTAQEVNAITRSMAVVTGNEKEAVDSYSAAMNKTDWDYLEYTYTYTAALAAGGAVTYYAPFWQFGVKDAADNADVGVLTDDDCKVEVYVDAIQAYDFDTAEKAFAAFEDQEY